MFLNILKGVTINGQIIISNIGNNVNTIALWGHALIATGQLIVIYGNACAAHISLYRNLRCGIPLNYHFFIGYNNHKGAGYFKAFDSQSAITQINYLANFRIYIINRADLQRIKLCTGFRNKSNIFLIGHHKVLGTIIACFKFICGIGQKR